MLAAGCGGGQSTVTVAIPDYVLVDSNDISTAQMSRETFWVATEEEIDEEGAEAIAIDVSGDSKDIDEVTVWIYDSEDAAKNGMITNKMYDVILEKGEITEVKKNELYS